ncbi:hypothetical protein ACMWN8_25645, partial [Escherichia coli]
GDDKFITTDYLQQCRSLWQTASTKMARSAFAICAATAGSRLPVVKLSRGARHAGTSHQKADDMIRQA